MQTWIGVAVQLRAHPFHHSNTNQSTSHVHPLSQTDDTSNVQAEIKDNQVRHHQFSMIVCICGY
jgi:hypothetical protein